MALLGVINPSIIQNYLFLQGCSVFFAWTHLGWLLVCNESIGKSTLNA
jgi:hypothetical protein